MRSGSRATVALALGVNLAVTFTKITAGIISGSSAMLSEGAHSISDSVNELFLVASVRRSERSADERHPFGYGAERFFWSLIAAVGIFIAGGGFSLFEAYRAFTSPPGSGQWVLEYSVLAVAAAFEGSSLIRALSQIRSEAALAGRSSIEHVVKSRSGREDRGERGSHRNLRRPDRRRRSVPSPGHWKREMGGGRIGLDRCCC
jgi:cation diffusion facilitator family transporter